MAETKETHDSELFTQNIIENKKLKAFKTDWYFLKVLIDFKK